MRNFEYVNAVSTTGAVKLLEQKDNSRVIAGGTD
jgi:CO/xanthine dehydrogenase FAD-binding subunit